MTPHFVAAGDEWPAWEIRWQRPSVAVELPTAESWDDERAILLAPPEGQVLIDRRTSQTTLLTAEEPGVDALVHPHLSSTAVIAAQWLGRTALHAGAFALDGRVWGLLGGRTMGKSSTLMLLHQRGIPVVADDVLVVDGIDAYSGPRCLDLREDVADRTGCGRYIGLVGTRQRWRVDLPAVAGCMPMGGWIALAWSPETEISKLPAASRMAALVANRGLLTPGAQMHCLLDLLSLPAVSFSRPAEWDRAPENLDRLLDAVSRF